MPLLDSRLRGNDLVGAFKLARDSINSLLQ